MSDLSRRGSPPEPQVSHSSPLGRRQPTGALSHGLLTSLREAVLAHACEALKQKQAFERLVKSDQDPVNEFLRSLQVLPPGTKALVVDERYRPKARRPSREQTWLFREI